MNWPVRKSKKATKNDSLSWGLSAVHANGKERWAEYQVFFTHWGASHHPTDTSPLLTAGSAKIQANFKSDVSAVPRKSERSTVTA